MPLSRACGALTVTLVLTGCGTNAPTTTGGSEERTAGPNRGDPAPPSSGRRTEAPHAETNGAPAITITADELAREYVANPDQTTAKYDGKHVRIAGKIGGVHENLLYLPTTQTREDRSVWIAVLYKNGKKPDVKEGDTATFSGVARRPGAFGPALEEGELVAGPQKK